MSDTGKWESIRFGYEKYAVQNERGTEIAFVHRGRDADLIVTACNAFPILVDALEKIENEACLDLDLGESREAVIDIKFRARAALALLASLSRR